LKQLEQKRSGDKSRGQIAPPAAVGLPSLFYRLRGSLGRVRSKLSGRHFRSRVARLRVRASPDPLGSIGSGRQVDKGEKAGHSLRRCVEPRARHWSRPRYRKINEALETAPPWLAFLDCGLDDVGGEEGGREDSRSKG
jgi:hypothetical protein